MPPKKEKKKKKISPSPYCSAGGNLGDLTQLAPSQILYTQSRLLPYFSGCGRTLESTLGQVASGELAPDQLPAIAVIAAEVEVGLDKKEGKKEGHVADDGWSSDEDGPGRGRGRRGGKPKRGAGGDGGGGGGGAGGAGGGRAGRRNRTR